MKINSRIIVSLVFIITMVFFYLFSTVINESLLFYLGIPFSFSISLFFLKLWQKNMRIYSIKAPNSAIEYLCYIPSIIAILAVLIIPQFSGSLIDWMNIPAINWFRLFCSLLLTTFLPGYFLLRILDRRNGFSKPTLIVVSCLLSILIAFLIGYCSLLAGSSITSIGSQAIIIINILLPCINFVSHLKEKPKDYLCFELTEVLLILSVLLTITTFLNFRDVV